MKQCPKISLVIPAYNEERYIGACLEHAVKNSNGLFHEIIVVDNVSQDKTREVALRYGVKVVIENVKGVTRARQRGYKESSGDIIAFIDADTRMHNGWVQRLIKEFEDNPNLAFLSGPYIYYDISAIKSAIYWWTMWVPTFLTYLFTGTVGVGGNTVIRRDVLDKMNGLDTSIEFYGDDTDTPLRASRYGKAKFSLKFYIPSSARRLEGEGVRTIILYVINYFSVLFRGRPVTKKYTDVR